MFCDGFAVELDKTSTPSLDTAIRSISQVANSSLSPNYSTSSSHFCAIVDVTDADFCRCHVQIGEFREFQEREAQNEASRAKIHTRRRDAKVGVVVAYHLGGRLGVVVGVERWGGKWRRLKMDKTTPRKSAYARMQRPTRENFTVS